MEEFPRQSHRIIGDPTEYTLSQLENIKAGKYKSFGSETGKETKTYTIIDSDVRGIEVNQWITYTILGLEVIETKFDQTQILISHSKATNLQITELIQTETDIATFSDTNPISKPIINEPEFDIFEPEIHTSATDHIQNTPLSSHVKLIIIDSIPPRLIDIEELVLDDEEKSIVSTNETIYILKILFRSLHPDAWYFTSLNFLGQGIP